MPWTGIVRVAVVIIVVVGALAVLAAWLGQRSLIYHPDKSAPALPTGAAEVTLNTGDGLDLTAWQFPPTSEDRGAAVLVAPGNAGNRGDRTDLGTALAAEGFTVLLLEYRGYGGNPGSPSEEGLNDDARAAWNHLRQRFDPDRIILFGESLGSGVATGLSTETEPAGLVLRSPFTSLADAGHRHYPLLPVDALLRDRFPVVEDLESSTAPVVVVYSDDDEVVPAEQSRRVAEAAENAGSALTVVEIAASGHNDPVLVDGTEVVGSVAALADDLGLTAAR